ncbi:MAG: LuxR C-terminal-related transcriptional regulator [Chitinispirillales bacterium]|jgi:LuxR family maltose regulon positive regulatory protein|nr:LuxR C-terminal-related transcriptional regulator [Chitinispirillales bacterium]
MKIFQAKPEAPRIKLMELFDKLSSKRVVYIHAPAGYGKSFSVKLWLEQRRGVKARWIMLKDMIFNTSRNFHKMCTTALLELQPNNAALKEIAEAAAFDSAPYEFAFRAIKTLKHDKKEYVIIIDDLHLLREEESLKALPVFIGMLPPLFTVFILSRSAPPDSFSELILKNDVAIVDGNTLKFTKEEIRNFFIARGHPLSKAEASGIYSRTGGWAIGINAILLSGTDVIHKKMAEHHFETFIRENVWIHWDEHLKDFMIKTSVVQELTPECATALTGEKNSKCILEKLLWENAFISIDAAGVYRFHDLFRDFLFSMLNNQSDAIVNGQFKKAADWFFEQKYYYRAAEYYVKSKDYESISNKILSLTYDDLQHTPIEDILFFTKLFINDPIVEKYPFLLSLQAEAAFADGNALAFERYADKYCAIPPEFNLQKSIFAAKMAVIRSIDYRNSRIELTKTHHNPPLSHLQPKETVKMPVFTISLNAPFFHRSVRDYSEYAFETDKNIELLEKSIGAFVGDEFIIAKSCICAGIHYEKGNLNEALKFAVSANTNLQETFVPELKFCAKMILASLYAAQEQTVDNWKTLDNIAKMIEREKAYYLNANFEAYKTRLKIQNGDEDAARQWLAKLSEAPSAPSKHIPLFKVYRNLTTARALICTGDYNTAMLLLQKLLTLVNTYKRPLDIIEVNILLAVTYWKKARGYQKDAIEFLERAIAIAQTYGFTQIFANEGAELTNMLQKAKLRIQLNSYKGTLSRAFIKQLYLAAKAEAENVKGLTGGRIPQNLKFTRQQLNVMRHLCGGHSYREIASLMGLKYTGIKSHMQLICKKLDVPDSIEAVMKIRKLKILE